MEAQSRNIGSESEALPMDSESPAGFDELELQELIGKSSLGFDDWISLISRIERTFPNNIEKICLVYDSFLSEFPLCHGYWRRYADHKIRLCGADEVVKVFERAVQSAPYSVGVWVDYCNFSMSAFVDPSDIRRLFKRGMSFVGKDYSCHALWDKYIQFELSQQQWSLFAHIYIEALRFPTKKLHHYYDSFKKLATLCNKDLGCQSNCFEDSPSECFLDDAVPKSYGSDEISCVIKDLFEPSLSFKRSRMLLQKYLSIGERFYQEACRLDEKISTFEANIRRSYFHVKSLEVDQLENWHHYLDFVEKQEDFDWVVKLYERCLIPCANYPEFWMRYVDFMETKGGREIANYALNRATQVFLKRVPVILLFNARFKEHEGDATGARSALLQCDGAELDLTFIENIVTKANMEKRLGNFVAASNIFEEALAVAEEKDKLHILPNIYVHFSQLKYMIASADAARDVLIDGIKRLPNCKLLLEELINFAIANGGQRNIPMVDSLIHHAISPGPDTSQCLNAKDAEDVSSLYLKFVDLCGNIHEVRKAWNRHIRLFPCSVRTPFREQITKNIKSLELVKEGKENTIDTKHQQPSQDCNPDQLVKLPLEDKKIISLLENYDSRFDKDSPNHMSEQKVPAGEKDDIQFVQESPKQIRFGEADSDVEKRVILPSLEVSEQLMEDMPETNVSLVSPEAYEQPNEGATKWQVAEGTDSEIALKQHSSGNDLKQECDHEPEQNTKTHSPDGVSLHAQDNTSTDLHPFVSSVHEAPQETCNFDGSMLESNQHSNVEGSLTCGEGKTNSSDSRRTEIEVVNISASRSHHGPISTKRPHRPCMPANSGRNWHQMNNSGKFHRESKFGSRGRLRRRLYHHQRQVSPQQHPLAELGGPMPMSQGYPSQVVPPQSPQIQQGSQAQYQYQATPASSTPPPPGTWPSQYLQQLNYAAPTQAMQSSGDHGMQNTKAYSQMWQYYYYQQQLFQQQQPQQQHLHLSQQYQQQQQIQLQQQYYSHPQQQQPYQQLQLHQQQQYAPQQQLDQQPQQQQYNQQQQQYLPQQQLNQQPQQQLQLHQQPLQQHQQQQQSPQQQLHQQPSQQLLQYYQQPQQQQQQHQLYMHQVVQQPPPQPHLHHQQLQTEQEQNPQQNSHSQVQELTENYCQQNASLENNGTSHTGPEQESLITASQDQEIPPADAREP